MKIMHKGDLKMPLKIYEHRKTEIRSRQKTGK